jgi:hypothetical protein
MTQELRQNNPNLNPQELRQNNPNTDSTQHCCLTTLQCLCVFILSVIVVIIIVILVSYIVYRTRQQ